jgi:hypothetical protein
LSYRSIYAIFIRLYLPSADREASAAHRTTNARRRAQGGGAIDKDRLGAWQRRVWAQRAAAVVLRRRAEDVRAHSRQLGAKSRIQQLAWCMAGRTRSR